MYNLYRASRGNYNHLRVLAVVLLILPAAWVSATGEHEGVVNTTDGVAIRGYDPVAYFTLGEPTEGNELHTYEWDGAEWRFASAEHRDRFAENPEAYAPRYGGYCAYAASRNEIADGDPELWTVEDGRLYLNLNTRFQRRFLESLTASITAADANWPGLRAELKAAAEQ